jgi:hypothetical protein
LAELCTELGHEAKSLWKCVCENFQTNFVLIQHRHSVPDLPNADRKICAVKIFFELTDQHANPCKSVYNWILGESLEFMEQLLSFLCSNKISIFEEENSSIILNALVRKYVATDFHYDGQRNVEELFLHLFCKIPETIYNDWLIYVLESEDNIVSNFFEKVLHICEMESGTMICKAKAVELLGKLAFKIQRDVSNVSFNHHNHFK